MTERRPPPTKSADRVKRYLDIIDFGQVNRGRATRYDIYREAMNEAQAGRMIKFLKENHLIRGNDEEGYQKTEDGEKFHEILRKHGNLVGIFTRELSGDRIRPW